MATLGLLRFLFILTLALGSPAWGGAVEAIPLLVGHVNDRTGTLTREQLATLERSLAAFEARKGSQIAVLVVPSTGMEPIEQYALRVAEQWKLGRQGVDDGALLVVAKDDRALRIEVGYGLEGALNDATCKRIISEIMVPRLRQGDLYGGLAEGVDRMLRVVEGEPLPPPPHVVAGGAGGVLQHLPLLFLLALGVGGVLRFLLGRFWGALTTGGLTALLAGWLLGTLFLALLVGFLAFFLNLFSGLGRHALGHGSAWGGGFGAGGFGGGGGSFGGGGASGRW